MKILLDENLPQRVRSMLTGHEVVTVDFMGWKGVENGALLKLARHSSSRGSSGVISSSVFDGADKITSEMGILAELI